MRKLLALLVLVGATIVVSGHGPADALTRTQYYKTVVFTFVVTPSPVAALPARVARPHVAYVPASPAPADPWHGPAMVSALESHWDVAPMVVAQATPQGNTPVQFNAQPDPAYNYLHFTFPGGPPIFNAAYGANTYTCAFMITTYWTTRYNLTDYGATTVASGSGPFPLENYPTPSYLSWNAPGTLPGGGPFTYKNSGSPGQITWSGNAGQNQTNCVDLTLTVPASQPAGTYTAPVQYNLSVSF